jgi:hypothetical protein
VQCRTQLPVDSVGFSLPLTFVLHQLYGTLLQPALLLFFVYWCWHRLDISLDAVVKYFASGFFVCTGISILFEITASMVASMTIYFISFLGVIGVILAGSIDLDNISAGDDDNLGKALAIDMPLAYSITIALITAFLNSFLVAALVEELGKYLCFWMVEHPDLEQDKILLSSTSSSDVDSRTNEIDGDTTKLYLRDWNVLSDTNQTVFAPTPTLLALGSATTVAMITVGTRIWRLSGNKINRCEISHRRFCHAFLDRFGIRLRRKLIVCFHLHPTWSQRGDIYLDGALPFPHPSLGGSDPIHRGLPKGFGKRFNVPSRSNPPSCVAIAWFF